MFFLESEDDVDKIVIKRLDVCDLKHLCGSIVDLAYANVRSRDAIDLGVCIISSPIYVFINREEKLRFFQAIQKECPDRFLAMSEDADIFLSCSQPHKLHYAHVTEAAGECDLQRVNVCVYGCKSAWRGVKIGQRCRFTY